MKLRKIAAMLLSLTLVSATAVTYVSAAVEKDEDPGVTVKAEVTEFYEDAYPVITLSISGEKFAPVAKQGLSVKSVLGAASVDLKIKLSELFNTENVSSDFVLEFPNQVQPSMCVAQPNNGIYLVWQTTKSSAFITDDTMVIKFAVEDADGVLNTIDEYNANLGEFTSAYINVYEYADKQWVYDTPVGNTADCKFPAKLVAGADKPVIEEKAPVVTGVTVTADKDVAANGDKVTFTAVVTGEEGVAADGSAIPVPQDVVWSDNAPEGVYTAVAEVGKDTEVTVTATAKGTEISGSKTITVSAKPYDVVAPEITGITIAPETVTVKGGEKVTFTAAVAGKDGQNAAGETVPYDKTVTWSENAPEGVFTAPDATTEAQTFEVTATTADGKVATATVKVYGETPIVGLTGVEVTDAKATLNDVFKAQNTMYWGVKITNGLKSGAEAWMTADGETSRTTTLDFSNITINGDAEFGIFTKVAADRLDKAISLNVKDIASGTVGMSTAASYNSLAK